MKQRNWCKIYGRNARRGFTLTEILLAVMIVGLIGVSLAALTRAAARESGVGRSRIMLRNNLSLFVRTLRADLTRATRVDYVSGAASCSSSGVALLQLAQNVDREDNVVVRSVTDSDGNTVTYDGKYVTYCFVCGTNTNDIVPSGATRDGKIYRLEEDEPYSTGNTACKNFSADNLLLNNVKYISGDYPVPLFAVDTMSRSALSSLLTVKLITELDSTPIVNEVIEETFAMPMGY